MFKNLNLNYRFSRKTVINLLITAAYALLTLIFVAHHEIWRDEAQVWLIIKNTSFSGLFSQLSVEGHPCLFYLLLYPFVKSGLSIVSMQIICWFSMVCSVFLLWQFSPFSIFTNTVISLSSGFLYFFPVIARSYSILPLLLFAAAILYAKQDKHPILYAIILACIANTHIIMLGFVGCLLLMFVYKNLIHGKNHSRKIILAAIIIIFSLGASVFQIRNTFKSNTAISFGHDISKIANVVPFTNNFITSIYDSGIFYTHGENIPSYRLSGKKLNNIYVVIGINISIFILILSLTILLLKIDKYMGLLFLFSILYQTGVYISSYSVIIPNRTFCFILILIFCLWVTTEYLKRYRGYNKTQPSVNYMNMIFTVLIIITIPNGIRFAITDFYSNYSSGQEMANFIQKNISEKNTAILTNFPPYTLSVSYYLKDRYLYFGNQPVKYSKLTWTENEFYINTAEYKKEAKDIYLIIPLVPLAQYTDKYIKYQSFPVIYITKPAIASGEDFALVKIN